MLLQYVMEINILEITDIDFFIIIAVISPPVSPTSGIFKQDVLK